MASRRYLNFDLLLEQEGEGRYQARVTDSPLGETPSVRFQLPFDATTLENLLLKLDPGRSGTRRVGATGQQQAAMEFGGPLYAAVFSGDLALAWQRSLDRARAEHAGGLRLRLRLNDAPAIAGLPWELLYDAKNNSFLAQSERTPVVRFLDVPQVPRPMTVDGPLRVLAVISSPVDLEELDVEAEWRRLQESLGPRIDAGLVVLDRLPTATLGDLGDWLRTHQTHVIHFVGHGDFDASLREGVVYFQDNHGKSSPVTASVLGPFVRDHDPLRMVVLNACRSARSDGLDPFAGMAQGLVQQDATAVVAMQFPISDRAAVTFTGEFYGALVEGLPVDQAISTARKSLLAEFRDEWATPVLFMRSPDGDIFANVHAVEGVAPERPEPLGEDERPPMPGPSFWKTVVRLVNRNRRLSVGVGIGLLMTLMAVTVLVVVLLVDDDSSDADRAQRQAPGSTPLPNGQMLVAAGDSADDLKIYVVDLEDPAGTQSVSHSRFTEWLPVLSPDRETMVYSRAKFENGNEFDLMVAAATTGDSAEPLFDSQLPQCVAHAGRPAWSQAGDEADQFLVLRCKDDPNAPFALLKVAASGRVDTLEVENPDTGRPFSNFGDPTISPDGSMVVVFATDDDELQAGGLYAITLADGRTHELLPATLNAREYSDAAFSPEMDGTRTRIAYRRNVGNNFDVYTAVLDGPSVVGTPRALASSNVMEEDPTFSPDGTRVVFTAGRRLEDDTRASVLQIVSTEGGTPVDVVVPDDFPPFAKVPAWTTR